MRVERLELSQPKGQQILSHLGTIYFCHDKYRFERGS